MSSQRKKFPFFRKKKKEKKKRNQKPNIPHSIIPSPGRRSKDDSKLGYFRTSDGGDELGAVLRDAALLGGSTDHEAGYVLEEDQGDIALRAELNEVGSLER